VRDAAVRGQRTYSGGAGILNHGTLALDRVTVADNRASGVGGGLVNSGTATIVASTFSGNRGDLGGAAIASGGTLTLTNSTLSDNRTDGDVLPGDPSAALSNFGTATLNGVTVAGNVTGNGFSPPSDIVPLGFAAGIWNAPGGAAVLRMSNTIVAGNTITYLGYLSPTTIDYLSAPADCRGTLTSLGYNIIGSTDGCAVTGVPAGNLTGVDPLLGPLADNGGPTATRALLPGSPAIDAGHPARSEHAPRACRSTDQRGFPRVGRCDIGAYEAQR
jgi:predicted outer membrane repeat protein